MNTIDMERFIVGSPKSTGIKGEFIRSCYKCGLIMYFIDEHHKNNKPICFKCAFNEENIEFKTSKETLKNLITHKIIDNEQDVKNITTEINKLYKKNKS